MITIVGLGPAGMDLMSIAALAAIENAEKPFLRTARHPAAQQLIAKGVQFQTFDHIYENAASFDEVYATIASAILAEAQKSDVVYAVPGHPLFAEKAVGLIVKMAKETGIEVRFAGSPSFIEACMEALAVSIGKGLKLIDALELDVVPPSPDCPNLIYQVYDREVATDVKLKLMDFYPDEFEIFVVAGGVDAPTVTKIPLYMLDHQDHDHLTSIFIPELEDNA